ncbi:MAG: HlyD family secretion protein, partial [Vicinamibacteria bacterium]
FYTALLVGGLVVYAGAFVFQSFGSDALAFYAVALVGLLHKPAITAASVAKDAGKEKWEKLGQEKKRFRFVVLWAGLALGVAVFPWHLRIPSNLNVLPQEREIVRAPSSGRIGKIYLSEGDRVEKGALILEYDPTELELERKAKDGELGEARAALEMVREANPTSREEIRVKEQALKTAAIQEDTAKRDLVRSSELWTSGLISKEQFDRDESGLAEATARRREAEAGLELARKNAVAARQERFKVQGMGPETQEKRIQQLEAELERLDDLLARGKIYASISGTLTTYRFQEKVGDYLEEGAEVCEIVNDDRVVVEMPVSEKDMDVVELGREVKFKVRGYPAKSFHGKVDEIAPVATPNGKSSAILVRAYVDNTDKLLKPGMTGVAKIYCGMSFVGNILTRDLVRFVRTEFWL